MLVLLVLAFLILGSTDLKKVWWVVVLALQMDDGAMWLTAFKT